jgi:hypothetical protein
VFASQAFSQHPRKAVSTFKAFGKQKSRLDIYFRPGVYDSLFQEFYSIEIFFVHRDTSGYFYNIPSD